MGEHYVLAEHELDENLDNLICLGNVFPGHQEDILQTRRNLITQYFVN